MAQTYVSVRLPEDLHAVLKALADNEDRTLISTLRMLLSQHLSAQPNVLRPKAIEPKKIEEQPLTPATKKPFIIQPRKPTVPVYGDASSDDYRPSWDDSETMS